MGTGKTSVGKQVARDLGKKFVDTDDLLEKKFDQSISEIFESLGESAFREAERELCKNLAKKSDHVISTGGGFVLSEDNFNKLAHHSLFCLNAKPDTILKRIESNGYRPLLNKAKENKLRYITKLLNERKPSYDRIAHQIEADEESVEEIAEQIINRYKLEQEILQPPYSVARVAGGGFYAICQKNGLLKNLGKALLWANISPCKVAIISNPNIIKLYGETLTSSLKKNGYLPEILSISKGEQHKTLGTVSKLYDKLIALKMTRSDAVLALGGGVVGDMAGFVASTFIRGMNLIQVPTTLLAMVDSSIGGKTGVNLDQGKNLVGTFYSPKAVFVDSHLLKSLSDKEIANGFAEMVKHGVIAAPKLFEALYENDFSNVGKLIKQAIKVKVDIINKDPYESEKRLVLNFGHTFGHAIELASKFAISHGQAVSIGMVAAGNLSASLGMCEESIPRVISECLEHLNLPINIKGYTTKQLWQNMAVDKKKKGNSLRLVVPVGIGIMAIVENPPAEIVMEAIQSILV